MDILSYRHLPVHPELRVIKADFRMLFPCSQLPMASYFISSAVQASHPKTEASSLQHSLKTQQLLPRLYALCFCPRQAGPLPI